MQFLARLFPFFVRNGRPQLKCSFFICKKRLKSAESSLTTQKTNMTMESPTIWRCISYQKNGGFVSLCHVRNFRGEVPHPSWHQLTQVFAGLYAAGKTAGSPAETCASYEESECLGWYLPKTNGWQTWIFCCPFCYLEKENNPFPKHPFLGSMLVFSFFGVCIGYGCFWDFGT